MDSDMLVISSIDHALFDFSNASFAAGTVLIIVNSTTFYLYLTDWYSICVCKFNDNIAPETFPPDTFNAGFMVLTPSEKMFKKLLQINNKIGSAEGGDQVSMIYLVYFFLLFIHRLFYKSKYMLIITMYVVCKLGST